MGKYILKRVLQFIPVFLGVTIILFALENIVPGDPIRLMAGEKKLDAATELNLRVAYHLVVLGLFARQPNGALRRSENLSSRRLPDRQAAD